MLKILHAHLLRTFVANLKIDAISALNPESLSDKYLAVRKVFAFSDSAYDDGTNDHHQYIEIYIRMYDHPHHMYSVCSPLHSHGRDSATSNVRQQSQSHHHYNIIIIVTSSSL